METQEKFAKMMKLSERSVSLKLNGKLGWKRAEIAKAREVLGLPPGGLFLRDFFREGQNKQTSALGTNR